MDYIGSGKLFFHITNLSEDVSDYSFSSLEFMTLNIYVWEFYVSGVHLRVHNLRRIFGKLDKNLH